MKRIIGIVVIMAVFWAGNWYWGLSTNLDKTAGWFGAQGDVFEHSEQHGFPNRYDVTLSDVTIADIGFDAEFVQILRVVYKSDHRIIILPNRVQIFGQSLTTDGMRASVVSSGAPTPRITIEAAKPEFPNGITAERAQISIVPTQSPEKITVFIELNDAEFETGTRHETVRATLHISSDTPFDWSTLAQTIRSLNHPITGTGTGSIDGGSVENFALSGNLRHPAVTDAGLSPSLQALFWK